MTVFDVLGWIGMILVVVAYILLSTNKVENGLLYQTLNLIAPILMAIGIFPTKAWFSFTLQIVWAVVAVIAIIKILKEKKNTKEKSNKKK